MSDKFKKQQTKLFKLDSKQSWIQQTNINNKKETEVTIINIKKHNNTNKYWHKQNLGVVTVSWDDPGYGTCY